MAAVRTNKGLDGMRHNFETCVAHIVPYCPVAKKRTAGTKRGATEISEVNADSEEAEVASFGLKSGKGPKTGVHIRYHKVPEYNRLFNKEKEELQEWRTEKRDGKDSKKKVKTGYKSTEKAIAAAVEKKVEAKMKALADSKSKEGEAEAFEE
jgi:hypothetical protein